MFNISIAQISLYIIIYDKMHFTILLEINIAQITIYQ